MNIEELRLAQRTGLRFSRNVVIVHINDPTATEFSFIDLPGMI
jgi:hypothetical protein